MEIAPLVIVTSPIIYAGTGLRVKRGSPYHSLCNKSQQYWPMNMKREDLWAKRSIGIKFWGFDKDPYEISKSLNALSDPAAKGEPHGSKSTFKENQLHVLKLIDEDSNWNDSLSELVASLGGVEKTLEIIESVKPKSYFVVINIPTADAWCGNGNSFSKETIEILYKLKTTVSFNYF